MNYYIFRIDYSDRDYFKENLEKGILKQGWGLENLSLLDENGEERNQEEWVNACPEGWRDTDEARRYLRNKNSNLRKMLEMKEGDIILIPKFPEWNMFSLYRVKGEYYFDLEKIKGDYGHCIPVEVATKFSDEIDKYFTYNGNDATKVIHSKLRGYQKAINSVYNNEIISAIESLLQIKSIKEESQITEILRGIFEKNIKSMKNLNKEIFSIRPDDVEKIVEEIFVKQGYLVESRNSYDRKGGDSDRTFIKPLPILSEVNDEIGNCRVYVQIKKKDGICDEDDGIIQLEGIVDTKENIEGKENKFNNFYKVLVCTGEFSPRIKELAQEKNIILIDGIQLIRMCLKNI
ncbi:restriction endonuclease [Fusobacterium hominis]|uniref:Restriction endonuclease n=1 Tax=Fusobacterium hominis TaxID=2764326 RepID=A0A7G9GYB2_9FUSO|nr:restriction endonuclease [Fusobacterium hominis]QNM15794.1 restriction endonuclease [Fusobacterium hominis]